MLGADQRGQAIQVGAIILFSFVVIAFSLYQATVVPDQNAEVEFNHNQDVQQDLLELRGSVLSAGTSGTGTTATVQLGTQYPARVFAVNPGAPSGSLRTVDPGGGSTVTIANAEAQNDETADFWSGTGSPREYTTRGIVYRPNYNEYREAPETVYENTVVYNRGPGGGVSLQTDQRLVSGREIDLTVLLGSYQADQSGSVSVDVSSPANEPRTVAVRPRGDPINITLPTSLSESVWRDVLEPEFVANGGYVNGPSVTVRGGVLSFELRETDGDGTPITYDLRTPAAGIGTGVSDPAAAYITDISGDGTSIPEGGTQQIVAEVRNEFNGPESGVNVCASDTELGTIQDTTDTTGEDGQVRFTYRALDDVDKLYNTTVTVSYVCDDSGNPDSSAPPNETAVFDLSVLDSDGSDNPIQLDSSTAVSTENTNPGGPGGGGGGQPQETLNFTLNNTGESDVTIDRISVDDTTATSAVEVSRSPGNEFERTDGAGALDATLTIGGSASSLDTNVVISAGTTADFSLGQFVDNNGNQVDMKGESATITLYFSDGRDVTITLEGN